MTHLNDKLQEEPTSIVLGGISICLDCTKKLTGSQVGWSLIFAVVKSQNNDSCIGNRLKTLFWGRMFRFSFEVINDLNLFKLICQNLSQFLK